MKALYFYLLCILLGDTQHLYSQNAVVGSGFSDGWGPESCPTGNANFNYLASSYGSSFGGILTPTGTGERFFRFGIDWSNMSAQQRTLTIGNDIFVNQKIEYTLNSACSTSGAMKINVSNNSFKYVFKTRDANSNPQGKFIFFEVQGDVRTITNVSQSPLAAGVGALSPVTIVATTDAALNIGQGIYLRYTTNNWASSNIIEMSGSGSTFDGTIPAQSAGITVKFYVLSSGSGLIIDQSNADFYTINGNTNNNNNYSYTVINGMPGVTVNPNYPTDNQSVTITFNATGTALAGSAPVYLHSGVSTTLTSPTTFNFTKGNWGLDDGVGLMTNISPNNWQITIPAIRSFYNVPVEKDVFGLNFLFRNASGILKEDNNGLNFYNPVNPGNYFQITSPTSSNHFTPVGLPFDISATANIAPTSWTLKEVSPTTGLDSLTINTVPGSASYTYPLTMTNAVLRKFKVICDFSGVEKYKTFTVTGYTPVVNTTRPSWVKPGINYHVGDPTKATLVLHAPTFTTFKKGTGTTTGTNNTIPKNIVYVIGDFNNWTASPAYKMNRDRDGWDGITDGDNDGDRGDYWWLEISGLAPGQEYVFQYLIDGVIQVGDPYSNKISDPDDAQISSEVYPSLITYRPQAIDRASVLQTNQPSYTWKALSFSKPSPNNLNIYELHFRDFTEEGTYLAAVSRLDYIKGLGINAIHVMPVSEFEGNSSWGYNPNFYFAADKAYGRAEDLKYFIDECHKRKIQVFNDLVLNHAFYSNVMAKMYWNNGDNKPTNDNPWFNPNHKMVRNSGGWWGADWNHESEHTQRMVDRILDYWIQEFKFDGFRFDFTKGFGQKDPNSFPPGDDWASAFTQDRVDLLKRMIDGMWLRNPGSVAIFEHLADVSEDKVLADHGILMWSGVGHHDAIKRFILGYDGDDSNIYDSGIYNAPGRLFNFANWMSYGESHDEERLGYEVMQYYNGTRNTSNMIDRLKIGLAFNLLFPGPRMLWQFQELGYDFSINLNGRTGEKPVRWDYYDDVKRLELYTLCAKLLKIRNRISLYQTSPDYGNIGFGAGNITTPRVMRLSSNTNKHVIIIANLDPVNVQTASPNYDVTGTWYKYNGSSAIDGTSFEVGSTGAPYVLNPSEVLVLTNFAVDECTDVRNNLNAGANSLRDAIACAPNNGIIQIEYPVYNQTINLLTPIIIDKNITITGFPSKNVTVSGAGFSGSVFSIEATKTVTMNGFRISCAQGGNDGRCMVNSGILTLDEMELKDLNGLSGGNSIFNTGAGTIKFENSVRIHK